jgi:hypothetical protein
MHEYMSVKTTLESLHTDSVYSRYTTASLYRNGARLVLYGGARHHDSWLAREAVGRARTMRYGGCSISESAFPGGPSGIEESVVAEIHF